MSLLTRLTRRSSRRKLTVQKPRGVLHPRVEKVGPQHFGVVCFDCHKAASKWTLADSYGKVLVKPERVKHTRPELRSVASCDGFPDRFSAPQNGPLRHVSRRTSY